jgi:nitrite reductase (cytochrome c-552)
VPISSGLRWVWVIAAALGMLLGLGFLDWETAATGPRSSLGEWETDPAVWGQRFPREYHSWRQARDPGPARDRPERLRPLQLFAGLSFAASRAPEPNRHPVGCQVCHDPSTLDLRLTQPVFLEALQAQGIDPAGLSRQDLKSYVCAQCHLARDRNPPIPLTAAGIVELSERMEPSDWNHAVSGTPLLKLRHPEFELWRLGIHAQRGVSCVECHMPYLTEGTVRITSHRMQSPLLDVHASCTPCHRWTEAELRARVKAIHDTTLGLQGRASEALLGAHRAVGEAGQAGIPEPQLKPLRALLRQAQTRWEFIASEQSTGFHAPQDAAQQLGIAIDQARQAETLARKMH